MKVVTDTVIGRAFRSDRMGRSSAAALGDRGAVVFPRPIYRFARTGGASMRLDPDMRVGSAVMHSALAAFPFWETNAGFIPAFVVARQPWRPASASDWPTNVSPAARPPDRTDKRAARRLR